MAELTELETLGRLIMDASVKAQFLGLQRVVDALDQAFSDVVREAVVEKDRRIAAEHREKALRLEEG